MEKRRYPYTLASSFGDAILLIPAFIFRSDGLDHLIAGICMIVLTPLFDHRH